MFFFFHLICEFDALGLNIFSVCVCVTEKRRLDLIPDSLCKQYIQTLQDALLPDLHKNLEDFR